MDRREADTDADDAVIYPPTCTLLAILEVREVWKARRSADSVRLEFLDPDAAHQLHDVCRDLVLALPFGDQSQGRAVIQVTVEHSEDREDKPTTPLPRALSKQFFRCALTAKAICTGPLANLELPTVEQPAEAIAATISQRTNTPPELQHAQWLTATMTSAGVEMHHHHTEPTLLRVGDDNLCAISPGKEDEEFADTLRLAVALTSPVALLRAIRLRTIVIYLTESEFDPSEHPFSRTIREAGELGGNTGHNQIRRAAIGLRKKARKTAPTSLALRATGRPVYTLTLRLTAHHHNSTDRTDQWRKTVTTAPESTATSNDPSSPDHTPSPRRSLPGFEHITPRRGAVADAVAAIVQRGAATERAAGTARPAPAPTATASAATAMPGAQADDEEELELNPEEIDSAMEVDTAQRKGKAATTAKHKKKQPRGRSCSDGATRNRSRSKPRLSGTRGSDNEWETDEEAAHPSSSPLM
eukprot:jgi/Tetstr1/455364/TSEL_042196.t1